MKLVPALRYDVGNLESPYGRFSRAHMFPAVSPKIITADVPVVT
jgi:hypothetical protein